MTYRAYLLTMDVAMRQRALRSAIVFDVGGGQWTRGDHIVRSYDGGTAIRFVLSTAGEAETVVGSYSGKVGTPPDEIAQYLVYFLETGKPWHQGLPNRGVV
jgi:hypothetical protein